MSIPTSILTSTRQRPGLVPSPKSTTVMQVMMSSMNSGGRLWNLVMRRAAATIALQVEEECLRCETFMSSEHNPTTVNFEGLACWGLQYIEPVYAESEQRKE